MPDPVPSFDPSRFAPVSRDEAAAAGVMPAPGPAPAPQAAAPVPQAAPMPKPVTADGGPSPAPETPIPEAAPALPVPASPRFVGPRVRTGEVAILDHVEYEGALWTSIPLRRPTSAEVGQYFERLAEVAAKDPERKLYFPCFAHPDGTPVPDAVLDFLDDDDRSAVMARAVDFLPSRLLRLLEA